MGFLKIFFNNTRKPEGLLGKWMLDSMNHAHSSVANWGIDHLPKSGPAVIAELGCGGGQNVKKLLKKYETANIVAFDYSNVSVEKTKRVNRQSIERGRCHVINGNVSQLPFVDNQFDLATAFETVYFWPGPTESFREVHRVLKPGGIFMIVNEADGTNLHDNKWMSVIDGLHIFNKAQLCAFLSEAGFSKIVVDHDVKKHWLCLLAIRETQ